MKNRVSFFCLHTCLLLFSFWTMYPALGHAADGNVISRLKFKQMSTLDGLPTDEVQKIYQDKEGFLWFATRYGFCKYDGYQITVYKSSLNTPGLLTSNNIYCFADDNDGFLWIGTQEGLNTLKPEKSVNILRLPFQTMRSHACWSPGKMRYGLVRIPAYAGMWQRRTPS